MYSSRQDTSLGIQEHRNSVMILEITHSFTLAKYNVSLMFIEKKLPQISGFLCFLGFTLRKMAKHSTKSWSLKDKAKDACLK